MVGTVTLSLELELARGLAHIEGPDPPVRHSPGGHRERERLERLLDLCDELDLRVSFDVVGHLLLGSCTGARDGLHPEGWFDIDPGTDRNRDPLYYAPDPVDRVRNADTEHEVCTRTFSRARCDEVSDAVIDWELTRVEELHSDYGPDPVGSFVPPVHAPPSPGVLHEHDIRTVRRPVEYRHPVEEPDPPEGALERTVWRINRPHPVETLLRSPAVASPAVVDGLVETYADWHASLSAPYLRNGTQRSHPVYRVLPRSLRQRRHRRDLLDGLREVAASGGAVHYWTRLFDLSNDVQWPPVRSFLETLADYRNREAVEIKTMGDLGASTA